MKAMVWVTLFQLGLLGTTLPALAEEGRNQPTKATTTKRVNFPPGGTIQMVDSYGDLNVEGWDQPEVEIIVIKSMPYDYKGKRPEEAAKHLDAVQIDAKLKSNNELVISTILPTRGGLFLAPLPKTTKGGVSIEYHIHVPRDSRLVIHHGTGSIFVNKVVGDIEGTCSRGDIMLMLPETGVYSINAKTKFGVVTSDFAGALHVRRYRLGERYATANSQSSRRIRLRMGFGGITIKAVPREACASTGVSGGIR
jgi:hypothetical protein